MESFPRSLITANSAYDRADLSPVARRGTTLIFSDRLNCFRYHPAPFFYRFAHSCRAQFQKRTPFTIPALKIWMVKALFCRRIPGFTPIRDNLKIWGCFHTPSLRNVAVTAPYMHDGSVQTLSGVIDIYAAGGCGRQDALIRTKVFLSPVLS